MTKATFTNGTYIGGGQLARIYDRLRKRSLRTERAIMLLIDTTPFDGTDEVEEDLYTLLDGIERKQYGASTPSPHVAYVRGVKDALSAIEREVV